jgi:hypothetical protein
MPDLPRARPRVLLTSVFGPFARDDAFGSRAINPRGFYHNQVTRAQEPFSLRVHHRSGGIILIQANISASSTVLDCPTREGCVDELTTGRIADMSGLSAPGSSAGVNGRLAIGHTAPPAAPGHSIRVVPLRAQPPITTGRSAEA